MTTWRLWKLMQNPPDQHPLFRHLILTRTKFDLKFIWIGLGVMILLMFFVAQDIAAQVLMLIPVLYALFNSTINGLVWGTNVTNTITLERAHGTYDVLCLIPDGALRVNWIIFTERLHYNASLQNSYSDMRVMIQILGFAIGFLVIGAVADLSVETVTTMGLVIVLILCVMLGLYADYLQTVVTCGLITLLAANATRLANDSRIWMISGFLLVQVTMYGLVIFMVLLAAPTMGSLNMPLDFGKGVLVPFTILLIYVAIREMIVAVLWRWLTISLNADQSPRMLLMLTR